MYFAVDLENKVVTEGDFGDVYSVEQFKKILENAAKNHKPVDMTMMCQRFVNYGFDFNKTNNFYKEAE